MAVKRKRKTPIKRVRKGRKVVQSKKVVIDGIQFASGLEGTMYKLLKEAKVSFAYEPKSYETFESFEYGASCWERSRKTSKSMTLKKAVRKVSYTPDFVCTDEDWFIETKGRANESFSIRWKLFKKVMNERDKPPVIFKPQNKQDCEQVIEELKKLGYTNKT